MESYLTLVDQERLQERLQEFVKHLTQHFADNLEDISLVGNYMAVWLKDKHGNDELLVASIFEANGRLRSDFNEHVAKTLVAGCLYHCGVPAAAYLPVQK